ncbi:hypothetical protein EXE46_12540 [Halorubrum sp. GN11_10-6_MGM]|uniref:hypothetical protein n=1 Tax=Halorubrum sp. GN11_10-6_MGM TaxID=2518112 RepID=UPI0010F64A0E|nr:hypothetical protein [Halorubrum sp. GN11_10-6_MGM]TKX73769.1 hypothetical protein EXE46_12540 [Halorubrum sp. GN11_10-6_MGM]
MSRTGDDLIELVIGLVVGNVAYLLSTLILSMIIGVAPMDIFSGPFSGTANDLVIGWVTIGGLLGIVDLLAVFGFISSLTSGW